MFDPRKILATLNRHGVKYVVVGGFAATLHGCPEQTYDVDILYADTPANRRRLLAALRTIHARWDRPLTDALLQLQFVFALITKFGDLDILNEIAGVGRFEDVGQGMSRMRVGRLAVPVLDLPTLICAKEAAADPHPRKRAALEYLKMLRTRRGISRNKRRIRGIHRIN